MKAVVNTLLSIKPGATAATTDILSVIGVSFILHVDMSGIQSFYIEDVWLALNQKTISEACAVDQKL